MRSEAITPADLKWMRKVLCRSPADAAAMVSARGETWEAWEAGEKVPSSHHLTKLIALKRLVTKMAKPKLYTEKELKE